MQNSLLVESDAALLGILPEASGNQCMRDTFEICPMLFAVLWKGSEQPKSHSFQSLSLRYVP